MDCLSSLEVPLAVLMLRSLTAEGWSQTYLAGQMDVTQAYVGRLMRQRRVRPETETAVRPVFLALRGRDPLAAGVHRKGVSQARNLARAEGWRVMSDAEAAEVCGPLVNAA